MKTLLSCLGFLATLSAQPQPLPRVYLGDARHPVAYGEVWLVVNGWGHNPGERVGVISEGRIEPDLNIEYPECSTWGLNCKLAVGIADKAPAAPGEKDLDTAYGPGETELSKRFPIWYLSPAFDEAEEPRDWAPVLTGMGHPEGDGVVLPRPARRTLTLLTPDGKPYAGAKVRVLLFGANNNHCGVAVGFPLGHFVSDAKGMVALAAPQGPLAVAVSYYQESSDGPAGTAYASRSEIVTGDEPDITLKRIWTLPEREYVLTAKRPGGEPVAGAKLIGCLWDVPCRGADCGPVGAGPGAATDANGVARFRDRDLRQLRNLALVVGDGRPMYLNGDELRELLIKGTASVTWREPPRPPLAPPREP